MTDFSSTRKVYFNAPAMSGVNHGSSADITTYPGKYDVLPPNEPLRRPVRNTLLPEARSDVIARKGWLTPDLTYENDWTEQDVDPESEDDEEPTGRGSARARRNGGRSQDEEVNESTTPDQIAADVSTLFPNNTQYGFRFMYNPPALDFSIGLATGVNFSYILSGAEKASPMIASGSSIGINLTISRVDDLAVLRTVSQGREPSTEELRSVLRAGMYGTWGASRRVVEGDRNGANTNQRAMSFMDAESEAKIAQLREIAQLGTMHDMNHLFRAFAAKNWKTAYRGTTADIGIAYSVPLVLYLSRKMIYRVRLANLNYTHRVFNPDMIPTLTDVSLSFSRIPDVVGWEGISGPGERLENRE